MDSADIGAICSRLRDELATAPRRETALQRLAAVWPVIQEARAGGVGWAEIGLRLSAVGIARDDGKPFTPTTLVWAAGRLEGRKPKVVPLLTQRQSAQTSASRPSPPRQSTPPPGEGEFYIPEVEALLNPPAGQSGQTIDDFLKGLNK